MVIIKPYIADELETYINKVREESYQKGYDAKMKIEPNYEMFNTIQTMFLLYGDMFGKWWEKEGCKLFIQSIKEQDGTMTSIPLQPIA